MHLLIQLYIYSYTYTSTPPPALHGLFYAELYLYLNLPSLNKTSFTEAHLPDRDKITGWLRPRGYVDRITLWSGFSTPWGQPAFFLYSWFRVVAGVNAVGVWS